ncbi:MAG: ABC transporter ATP-binding protein [Candidatus Parcubacteria bacterium]|nr:MAG: ABC transporter ATP-binding protein [Candidatus Parcubacteria bacterium]
MDKTYAIVFDNVTKKYPLLYQKTLKEFVQSIFFRRKTFDYVTALKKINLKIAKGESIGVIGQNGSGKSTFLKLIAGVSFPTVGNITVNGRIVPLIELGAGFHPELTGKENIFLNGVILGLSEQYLVDNFLKIVEFSEISMKFIYTPVKYYSSGMFLRLAFSVAIFSNPDILLVDEILSVGDTKFQKKCLDKMFEFKKENKTIVFVSHNLNQIKEFAERLLVLKNGSLIYDGSVDEGINYYLNN